MLACSVNHTPLLEHQIGCSQEGLLLSDEASCAAEKARWTLGRTQQIKSPDPAPTPLSHAPQQPSREQKWPLVEAIESPVHHPGIGLHENNGLHLDVLRLAVADANSQGLQQTVWIFLMQPIMICVVKKTANNVVIDQTWTHGPLLFPLIYVSADLLFRFLRETVTRSFCWCTLTHDLDCKHAVSRSM